MRTDTPLCALMGLLSGLETQGEISELLDELYGEGPTYRRKNLGSRPYGPGLRGATGTSENPFSRSCENAPSTRLS